MAKSPSEISFSRLESWKIRFYRVIGLKKSRILNKSAFEKEENGPELDFLLFCGLFLAVFSIY